MAGPNYPMKADSGGRTSKSTKKKVNKKAKGKTKAELLRSIRGGIAEATEEAFQDSANAMFRKKKTKKGKK